MTAPAPVSPDVAEALRESAQAMRDVTEELRHLRPDVRRSVRATRYAIALVALLGVIAGSAGWLGFDSYRDGACERGNATRAAVVDGSSTAAETAVESVGRRLTDGDADRGVAVLADEVGAEVRDAVSADPKLAQRDCG